jgi:glycosyltransferase involved in cell wall biosynthesis
LRALPETLRLAAIEFIVAGAAAARAWVRLITAIARTILHASIRLMRRQRLASDRNNPAIPLLPANQPGPDFESTAAAGDVILVLGSPWSYPDYAELIGNIREKHQLRVAILVYDLIPIRRPEWCDSNLVRLFGLWFNTMLPICDHVFAISKATASDLQAYAAQRGITLPQPIVPLPIGTGLSQVAHRALQSTTIAPLPPQPPQPSSRTLPESGTYALLVSTIEARKNHLLMFRVWRRLLEDLPPGEVPTLVFAGRVGWLVDDLMRQISNTNNLDGKLILIENPTDSELVPLYKGCLFTVCPSFYEGWGLPVTESLALGKPCLISNRTSLPEAGAGLARSFDPDNLHEAYAAIRAVIEDRADLAAWEAQVQREFKPVPWSATVDALLDGLVFENQGAYAKGMTPKGIRAGLQPSRQQLNA